MSVNSEKNTVSALRGRFMNDMKDAMKNKNEAVLSTVRLINAALKDKDIDARGKGNPNGLSDAEIMSLLQAMIKQRQESLKIYQEAGRAELAAQEQAEITVIQGYLPEAMGEAEMQQALTRLITELSASSVRDMGKVMAEAKNRYAGQMDMTQAGAFLKSVLK